MKLKGLFLPLLVTLTVVSPAPNLIADNVNVDKAVQKIMHTAIENFCRKEAGQPDGAIPNWKVDSMDLKWQPTMSLEVDGGDPVPKVAAGYFGYSCNDKGGDNELGFDLVQGNESSVSAEWTTGFELSAKYTIEGSAEIAGLGAKESAEFGITVTEDFMHGNETSTTSDLKVINTVTVVENQEVAAIVQVEVLELENSSFTLTITGAGHFEVAGLCYVFGRGDQTCTHISDQIENLVDEEDLQIVLHGHFQSASGSNPQAVYHANSAQYAWAITEDIKAAGGCKGKPDPAPANPPAWVVPCPKSGSCNPSTQN